LESGLLHLSHDTVKIPPFSSNPRRPANIPLHTLSSSSRPINRDAAADDAAEEKLSRTPSDLSIDSDFSVWSDTGDLVDQLAAAQDPLDRRLQASLGQEEIELLPRASAKHKARGQKRARFHPGVEADKEKAPGIVRRKEDIRIPSPPPRKIPLGEKLIVLVMAPNDGPSRIHGLHGKKLLYAILARLGDIWLTERQILHHCLCIVRCVFVWVRSGSHVGYHHVNQNPP